MSKSLKFSNGLALETSGQFLSIALLNNGQQSQEFHEKIGFCHEQVFWEAFPALWKKSKLKFKDLDFIAATRGPGRFTGIRFGLALANAWSSVCQIPLFAPTTIELLRWQSQCPEASFLVSFSGAWAGQIGGSSIASHESALNFFREVARRKNSSNRQCFYWAEDAKRADIKEAYRHFRNKIKLDPLVPQARSLTDFALSPQGKKFFTKSPATPIYLKESWK